MARWSLHPTAHTQARVVLIPTAFGPDTQAPAAILTAGAELCGFEPLLGIDVDGLAIAQVPALMDEPPYSMCEAAVQQGLRRQQWPVLLPSVMSASWGAVRAIWKQHRSLTVVHCSAHANLLPSPELIQTDQNGSYSPTGWVERLYQNQLDIVHMGLRSVSSQGWQWLQDHKSPVFWAQQDWQAADVVAKLSPHPVFLVIDSSVLDPALVSAVPHPEPGGLDWNRLLQTCQSLFAARPVVGLAVGGLTVVAGVKQSARPVARLLNWILACHGLYPQGSPSAMVGAVQESRF